VGITVFGAILLLTGTTLWVDFDEPKADSWLWRISISAADTSLVLIAATLLWGPVRVLRHGRPVVHHPWRRALGIWAGLFGLAHVALAVFVHASWDRLWTNWFLITPPSLAGGPRGVANWLGVAQVTLVVLLLWLSRDQALRRLGPARWKRLQRSTYVLAALVAVHAVLYFTVEQRIVAHRLPVIVVLLTMAVGQLAGLALIWRRNRTVTGAET
jgi:DMSO/TMAO reductase YedYZ heme-binding membrane subunit